MALRCQQWGLHRARSGHPVLVAPLSRQLFQQHLRLLEVHRLKALGEPAIDRRQEVTGCGVLALLLPQALNSARRAAPRPGLLLPGDRQRLLEQASAWAVSGGIRRHHNSPLSRCASASRSPRPLAANAARASAAAPPRRHLADVPPPRRAAPARVAARALPRGHDQRQALGISARPAALAPCMARAQPRQPCPYPV